MKKSFTLLCSIFLIGFILNGCASGKASVPSTTSSAVQNSSASENRHITLKKEEISRDVVFRKTSAADGEIVLTSDQIEKIEMKPSQMPSPGIYDITFYLTKESRKQFAADSRKIAEAKEEMSIWGKDGKVASAKITDPILDGTFVLYSSYNSGEAKRCIEQFSARKLSASNAAGK